MAGPGAGCRLRPTIAIGGSGGFPQCGAMTANREEPIFALATRELWVRVGRTCPTLVDGHVKSPFFRHRRIAALHRRAKGAPIEVERGLRAKPKTITFFDQTNSITALRNNPLTRDEFCRLPAFLQHWTLKRLDDAYKAFFARVKRGEQAPGFPRFRGRDSFATDCCRHAHSMPRLAPSSTNNASSTTRHWPSGSTLIRARA
jgi:hypothetical protein